MAGRSKSGWKIFAVVALVATLGSALLIVRAVRRPPESATINCDRARGHCDFASPSGKWSLVVAKMASAQIRDFAYTRPDERGEYVEITLRDGSRSLASDRGQFPSTKCGYREVVKGLNHFIADPGQPTFVVSFTTNDAEIFFPSFLTALFLIGFVIAVKILRSRP